MHHNFGLTPFSLTQRLPHTPPRRRRVQNHQGLNDNVLDVRLDQPLDGETMDAIKEEESE